MGFMPVEDVERILNNVGSYVIGVGLGRWGEPLQHPDLIDVLKLIESRGLLISFDTNGLIT